MARHCKFICGYIWALYLGLLGSLNLWFFYFLLSFTAHPHSAHITEEQLWVFVPKCRTVLEKRCFRSFQATVWTEDSWWRVRDGTEQRSVVLVAPHNPEALWVIWAVLHKADATQGHPRTPPKPSVLSHWAKSVPICPLTSYFFFFLFLLGPFKPLLFFFSASTLLSDVGRDERKGQLHLLAICTPSSLFPPPLML